MKKRNGYSYSIKIESGQLRLLNWLDKRMMPPISHVALMQINSYVFSHCLKLRFLSFCDLDYPVVFQFWVAFIKSNETKKFEKLKVDLYIRCYSMHHQFNSNIYKVTWLLASSTTKAASFPSPVIGMTLSFVQALDTMSFPTLFRVLWITLS